MRKLGRHRRIHRDGANPAALESTQQFPHTLNIHGFGQHVLHDLVYQRMIGNLNVSLDIFLTRGDIGKHRRQQIVRADALNLRRNLLPALKTKQC